MGRVRRGFCVRANRLGGLVLQSLRLRGGHLHGLQRAALTPLPGPPMTSPLYNASIPVFRQMLGSLKDILAKTEAHATARKIEPDALLQARLFPDMFPLARQVLIACDFAKGVAARKAVCGRTLPAALRPAAVLLPRERDLRHCAPQRRGAGQARLYGPVLIRAIAQAATTRCGYCA